MNTDNNIKDNKSRFSREKLLIAIDKAENEQLNISQTIPHEENKGDFGTNSFIKADEYEYLEQVEHHKKNILKTEINNFATQKEELFEQLNSQIYSLSARFIFSAFAFILLAWIEIAAVYGFALPSFVSINTSVFYFALANLLLLFFATLLCGKVTLIGAVNLVRLKPDSASLVTVAILGALASNLYLLIKPKSYVNGDLLIFSAVAAACLTFNLLGRILHLVRAKNGLFAIPEDKPSSVVRKVSISNAENSGRAACPTSGSVLDCYIESTFAPTIADYIARIMSPILLIIATLFLGAEFIAERGLYHAVNSFAAICCVGAPVMFELCISLPMQLVSKRLRKYSVVVTGYDAIAAFSDIGSVVVKAEMLFIPEASIVHGIKTFGKSKIEKSILDTASVINAVGGPLAPSFLALISEENKEVLETVENIVYRDEMGLCAKIDGEAIFVGNRDLLRRYEIEVPSREFEAKYSAEGHDILYYAVGNEINAVFIVSYGAHKTLLPIIKRLERTGVTLLVETTDANITPSMICDKFGININSVKLLTSTQAKDLRKEAETKKTPALIAASGHIRSFGEAVLACIRLDGTLGATTAVQVAGSVLGVGLIIFFGFSSGTNIFNPVKLLEFQGIFALPALLIALFRKN